MRSQAEPRDAAIWHDDAHYCECYGEPEGTPLCDECLAEERERELERADRLFEEEVYLYGI